METHDPSSPSPPLTADLAWLSRLALRLVRDPHLADDVCQQAWLEATAKLGRQDLGEAQGLREQPGPGRESPSRVALGLALRGVLMHARRSAQRRQHHEAQSARSGELPSTVELLLAGERQALLWRHVSQLDEPYRTSLLLRFQQGLSAAEIAAAGGLPADTARWRIRRGLELLKSSLDRDPSSQGLTGLIPVALIALHPWSSAGQAAAVAVPAKVSIVTGMLGMHKLVVAAVLTALALWIGTLPDSPPPAHLETLRTGSTSEVVLRPGAVPPEVGNPATAQDGRVARKAAPFAEPAVQAMLPSTLLGRVLNEHGQPQGEVDVRLVIGEHTEVTRTDPSGHFRLRSPRQESYVAKLFIEPPLLAQPREIWLGSHPDCEWPAVTIRSIDLGDLEIRSAAILRGRVVDDRGAPIPGAEVQVGGQGCLAGASGEFVLGHLDPDETSCTVKADGYLDLSAPVGLTAYRELDIGSLSLRPGTPIRGTVRGPDGQTVAGARVASKRGREVVTDHLGRFVFTPETLGHAALSASAAGYRAGPWIHAEPGAEVDLELGPAGEVGTLRLLDRESGDDISSAEVLLVRASFDDLHGDGRTESLPMLQGRDPAGKVHWQALTMDGRDEYVVRAPGYSTRRGPIRSSAFRKSGQTVRLQRHLEGSLVGRFLSENSPLAEARVELHFMPYGSNALGRADGEAPAFAPSRARRFYTDLDGRFEIPISSSGYAQVRAALPSGHLIQTNVAYVEAGADVDFGDTYAVRPGRLWGRIQFADGSPYAHGRIALPRHPERELTADEFGRYELNGLASGRYRLVFSDALRIPGSSRENEPRNDAWIELAPGEERSFDIVLPDELNAGARCRVELRVSVNGAPIDAFADCGLERPGGGVVELEELRSEGIRVFECLPGSGTSFWADLHASHDIGPVDYPGRLEFIAGPQTIELEFETAAVTLRLPRELTVDRDSTALLHWNNSHGDPREPLARMSIPGGLQRADAEGGRSIHFPHVPIHARDLRLEVISRNPRETILDRTLSIGRPTPGEALEVRVP